MIKVKPIKGFKSLRALNAFNILVLGLKMLPAYMKESYEDFLARLHEMPEADQRKMLKEAAMFVELQPDELEALVYYATDKNGVPYSAENQKNLGPDEIVEIIVAVCLEISKIRIDIVSEKEKKN